MADRVTSVTTWRWSPSWTVAPGTDLVLSAGADRQIAIDGLSSDTVRSVRGWAHAASVRPDSNETHLLVDRLVELGVLGPTWSMPTPVGLVAAGEREDGVLDDLARQLGDLGHPVSRGAVPGAPHLVVRLSDGDLPDLPGPHLGLDLRLHHTVVIGPLVVPGHTACLRCLDQRLARRWAPAPIPSAPAVQRWIPAVAALVAVQLERAAAGVSPLINATASWDLEQGTVSRESLFKVVGCATCDVATRSGRVRLPWAADR